MITAIVTHPIKLIDLLFDSQTVIKWLWTWRCAAILSVLALILVTIIVVVSVMLTKHEDLLPLGSPIGPDGKHMEL